MSLTCLLEDRSRVFAIASYVDQFVTSIAIWAQKEDSEIIDFSVNLAERHFSKTPDAFPHNDLLVNFDHQPPQVRE